MQQIYLPCFAFAALKGNDTVVTCIAAGSAGEFNVIREQLAGDEQQIYSTGYALTA